VAKLRAALLRGVKAGDMREVIAALLTKAKNGDVQAAKLFLAYTVGEPVAVDVIERIETLEALLGGAGTPPGRAPWKGIERVNHRGIGRVET
jgi:hypothetical protein